MTKPNFEYMGADQSVSMELLICEIIEREIKSYVSSLRTLFGTRVGTDHKKTPPCSSNNKLRITAGGEAPLSRPESIQRIIDREINTYDSSIRALFEDPQFPYSHKCMLQDTTVPCRGSVVAVFSTIGRKSVGGYSYNYRNNRDVMYEDLPKTGRVCRPWCHMYDANTNAAYIIRSRPSRPVLVFIRSRKKDPFTFGGIVNHVVRMPDERLALFIDTVPFNGVHAGTIAGKKFSGKRNDRAAILAPRFGFLKLNNRFTGATHFIHARERPNDIKENKKRINKQTATTRRKA